MINLEKNFKPHFWMKTEQLLSYTSSSLLCNIYFQSVSTFFDGDCSTKAEGFTTVMSNHCFYVHTFSF